MCLLWRVFGKGLATGGVSNEYNTVRVGKDGGFLFRFSGRQDRGLDPPTSKCNIISTFFQPPSILSSPFVLFKRTFTSHRIFTSPHKSNKHPHQSPKNTHREEVQI